MLAVTDVVYQALIAAIVTVILAWMQQRTRVAVQAASDVASNKVDAVKEAVVVAAESATIQSQVAAKAASTAVDAVRRINSAKAVVVQANSDTLSEIQRVTELTHALVNSNMGKQLQMTWIALRRVAELTKDNDDIAAAELAETLFREHQERQAIADAKLP